MPRRRTRADWRVTHEIHERIIGILSRPGELDDKANEIHDAYLRAGWKPPGPTGLNVSRCRIHTATALQNGRCPTCGWSPLT
jgi:hypothetical protein